MLRYKLVAPGKIIAEEVPQPTPSRDDTLVEVKACGICGTDIHAFHGKHPFIHIPIVLGHEFSGVEVTSGKRVVVEPSVTCGKCYNCRSGRYNICNELKVLGCQTDGAFSQYVVVRKDKVLEIPDKLSFEEASLVEPTAVAVHGVKIAGNMKEKRSFVFGAGPIGLLTLQVLKTKGARDIIVADISEHRLGYAKDLGASYTVNPLKMDPVAFVKTTFGVDGIDVVFECVGGSQSQTINKAIELIRKGEKIVVLGVFSGEISVKIDLIQDRELNIMGSLMYTRGDFSEAIKLICDRQVNVKKLISQIIPMRDVAEAFKLIDKEREKIIKIVLVS
ncbi:MAG: zinc-binding dehydrogenase [Candidatus Bathyarchaeia archaeon]